MTWRGASEPVEGLWPEACRHLSAALLKCLFITLFQLHLLLSSASLHANPNMPGLSRLIQSVILERREPFPPSFPPSVAQTLLPPCFPKSDTLGENWVGAEGRAKEGKGVRDGWIEEKREGVEVYFMQHGLLNWFQSSSWTPGMHGAYCRLAVFAFVGCRKFDHYPCSQPPSHPSIPSRMKGTMRTKPLEQVARIRNFKSKYKKRIFHLNVEWLHHITWNIFLSGSKTHVCESLVLARLKAH